MSEEVLDSLWIEKYRPKTLDDMSLPERYTQDFKRVIERGSMPNFLFSGPPGGGKTTLALILASKQGVLFNKKDNLLTANGSSKKGRSINFVDQVVEPFLKHPPAGGDKYKIVFMDEADNITPDAYDSWRGVIEKYHKEYGRFIWTCNYVSKIPDPVQSRFTPYIFQQIPKEFVEKYAKTIMASENIEYTDKDITFVVNQLYPDVRKIVNILQRCSYDGKLVVDRDAVVTSEKILISHIIEIVSLIAKNEENKIGAIINSIIDILAKQDLEYRNIYTELFYMKTLPAQAKIIVNKAANSHQACLIPHMHFMAMVFDIIKSLQAYKKAMMGK
jgi:replication factor C small subunit